VCDVLGPQGGECVDLWPFGLPGRVLMAWVYLHLHFYVTSIPEIQKSVLVSK
jgi:hypothetical protein